MLRCHRSGVGEPVSIQRADPAKRTGRPRRRARPAPAPQIAERIGRSPATIKAYFYDPLYADKRPTQALARRAPCMAPAGAQSRPGPQQGRTHAAMAWRRQPYARSRPALERTQGALLERVREPAVGWQQPPVVRSAQLGERGRSRPRGRRDYRNRGVAIARPEHAREPKQSCRAQAPHALDVADCDSAPSWLGGRLRASTITSCVGMDRIEGGRDLDHLAVAWPGLAVISSLPARSLLPIVHLNTLAAARLRARVRRRSTSRRRSTNGPSSASRRLLA